MNYCFNGGPDNCPAKPNGSTAPPARRGGFNGGPDNCPAKQPDAGPSLMTQAGFNGGPDNCPAKRVLYDAMQQARKLLQWRAGQLPGQTLT